MRARPRPALRSSRHVAPIARIALAIVEELERGAAAVLGLVEENRRLKRRLRALANDKAILQRILRRER